jgi:hypothetical protein
MDRPGVVGPGVNSIDRFTRGEGMICEVGRIDEIISAGGIGRKIKGGTGSDPAMKVAVASR